MTGVLQKPDMLWKGPRLPGWSFTETILAFITGDESAGTTYVVSGRISHIIAYPISPLHIHDLLGVTKRRTHVGRDVPTGELFRPIYYNHSSMEAAIERIQTQEKNYDIEADIGRISIGVEILIKMSHKTLTSAEENIE